MNYIALNVALSEDAQAEILTAYLADYPFESFESEPGLLKAYIPRERLCDCKTEVDDLLARHGLTGRYVAIETQNWNALWESNFPPVEVDGRLRIRAPFHAPSPAGMMEIVMMPRMAFGTGHHATTQLMARAVLDLGVAGRTGLDMGSGTGVLAIAALKCGAAHMDAVDIDDWADASCRENAALNGVAERITAIRGDAASIAGRRYDFILANINRNILLADMPAYAAALAPGGDLVMSGFLEADVEPLTQCAARLGLKRVEVAGLDGWMLIKVKGEK